MTSRSSKTLRTTGMNLSLTWFVFKICYIINFLHIIKMNLKNINIYIFK